MNRIATTGDSSSSSRSRDNNNKKSLSFNIKLFVLLCVFRVSNTFLIRSYFDPDEYWQTLEPAYCEVFADNATTSPCEGFTWEWTRRRQQQRAEEDEQPPERFFQNSLHGPVRSYLSILPVVVYYWLLKRLGMDTRYLVAHGPKWVYAIFVAAPVDWAVFRIGCCVYNNQKQEQLDGDDDGETKKKSNYNSSPIAQPWWWCLFVSVSNWFNAYCITRTYSNCLETVLLSCGIILVAPELLEGKEEQKHARIRLFVAFLFAGWSVCIRFSSVTAWAPIGLLCLYEKYDNQQQPSSSLIRSMMLLAGIMAGGTIIGILLCVLVVDYYFYGFYTLPLLGSFHFNVILGHASLYGTHPWHWYFTSGVPAITGIFFPFLLCDFFDTFFVKAANTNGRGKRNLWIVVLCFVVFHSFSAHKEFRFLLPLVPLFCVLGGPRVQSFFVWLGGCYYSNNMEENNHPNNNNISDGNRNKPQRLLGSCLVLIALVVLPNFIAVLYLGLYHQSAPISVNQAIADSVVAKERRDGVNSSPITMNSGSNPPYNYDYSIHYLTGACHSTPIHSQLHIKKTGNITTTTTIRFDTWSLDCSPGCRSSKNNTCETERFQRDPVRFIKQAYQTSSSDIDENSCSVDNNNNNVNDDDNNNNVCRQQEDHHNNYKRNTPDYLVVMSGDYEKNNQPLKPLLLDDMGFEEVARFFHCIHGIKKPPQQQQNHDIQKQPAPQQQEERKIEEEGSWGWLFSVLEIEEMVLLEKKKDPLVIRMNLSYNR